MCQSDKLYDSRVREHIVVHLGLSVSSFAHNCGCVVDDGGSNLSFIIINKLKLYIIIDNLILNC